MKFKTPFLLITLLTLVFSSSCRKDLDRLSWDTDMLIPIAKTELSLEDLLKDTLVSSDENNLLQIVYRNEIAREKVLDTLVQLDVNSFQTDVTLTSLAIEDIVWEESVNVGDLLIDGGIDGNAYSVPYLGDIIVQDGATVLGIALGFLPAIDMQPNTIDIGQFFSEGVLSEGFIDIQIDNNTSFAIAGMKIEVKDKISGEVIYLNELPAGTVIDAGESYDSLNYDLAAFLNGNTIHSQLEFAVTDVKIINSQIEPIEPNVTLDYSDSFKFSFKFRDIKVEEATAIFPAQNIVEKIENVPLLNMEEIELKNGKIKKGKVHIRVTSTLPTDMYFDYLIPGATKGTERFSVPTQVIQAGSKTNPTIYDREFSIAGYELDFSGVPQDLIGDPKYDHLGGGRTNVFIHEIYGRIDKSGTPISLSLQDSISIEIEVIDLETEYVEGYIGNQKYEIGPDVIDFAFTDEIPLKKTKFENIDVSLIFENNIGVPVSIDVEELVFTNTEENTTVAATGVSEPINVPSATLDGETIMPGMGMYTLPNSNEAFNLSPNQVNYTIALNTNPNGNSPLYSNFADINSEFTVYTDVYFPLSIITSDFVLTDTVSIKDVIEKPEEIKDGIINLIVNNGFPFLADVELIFQDEEGLSLDTLKSIGEINAASVDEDGIVLESEKTVVPFYFPEERLSNVLGSSKNIVIKLTINSVDQATYRKIYSYYTFDVRLTGDFKFRVNSKL